MQLFENSMVIDEATVVVIVVVVSEDGNGNNARHCSSSHGCDDDDDDADPQPLALVTNELVIKLLLKIYSKNANNGG